MMQFTRFFDLQDGVLSEVVDESSSLSGENINLRVVGQEQNHELLMVWDDYLPFSSPKMMVTFIGSYHPTSKQFMKLFTFESTLTIVNCSLSPDRCVIAYTTYSTKDGGNCIYRAYLAEIHNRVRTCIYSLNLHHTSFIKVQFLWPLKNCSDGDPITKETRLLVLLHNKSVGLYTINLRRTGIGMVLHNLPVAEQVCGSFIWAQWDKLNQRLYLLVPRTKSGKTKNIFRCLEFTQGGAIPSTPSIEMELPFPVKDHHSERNFSQDSLSNTISEDCLNMQVITQSQGIFCICYQHVSQKPRRIKKTVSSPILRAKTDSTPTSSVSISVTPSEHPLSITSTTELQDREDVDSRSGLTVSLPTSSIESHAELKRTWSSLVQNKTETHTDISYSILCVHKSTIVSAKVHEVPKEKATGLKLFFDAQDGYIFVYSPGVVQHLVNVTPEFTTSSHHIALHPVEELYPPSNSDQTASKLGYVSCELTSRSGSTCVFDIPHLTAFQYNWNKKVQLCQSLYPCLAKPLLHYAIIQARDSQMREQIMTHLTQDPTDPELVQIFLEFIISSTYAAMRKQVDDQDVLDCFPFTTELTKQQLLHTREGERIATFTTSSCKYKVDISTDAGLRTRKLSYNAGNPYLFSRLRSHLERIKELDSKTSQRFSTLPIKVKIDQITEKKKPMSSAAVTNEPPTPIPPQIPTSTLRWAAESVLKLTRAGRKRSKTKPPDVQPPAQAIPTETEDEWYFMRKLEVHIEALQSHLLQLLTYASSEKLLQIATTYCDCQIQQVYHLMNILTRSAGLDDKSSPSIWDTSLNILASGEEQNLLLLMERVFVTTETHCLLVPKDFLTHFVCLGFRCLEFPSFLQYVQHGIFHLNRKFLLKLLKDLPDDERANREKKKMTLSILPSRDLEMEMLRSWNHPEGNAILTKIYLKKSWFSETASLKDNLPDQLDSLSANFPPLASLLSYTQHLGSTSSLPPDYRNYRLSSGQIASAALFNAIQTCGEDLQGFTF